MSERKLIDDVRNQYAGVAKGGLSNDSDSIRSIASAFGYSEEELNQLPAEANMGLSCGNPLALAGIREGEVVVDLGCGGGMDVSRDEKSFHSQRQHHSRFESSTHLQGENHEVRPSL